MNDNLAELIVSSIIRVQLLPNEPLDKYTWLRVGGAADLLFQPADEDDLSAFLSQLPKEIPVTTCWCWL